MAYETRAYDNERGDPVVVLVAEGTHDVSRLVNLLQAGNCEQVDLGGQVVRQVRRHNGGRAALQLLAAHGGRDLLFEVERGADATIPAGLDARPAIRYTAHCSHCGKPAPHYESETPCLWRPEDLTQLGNYHLEECGWKVNLPGAADPDFGGRMLVCPDCWTVGWCETCGNEIHAWQPFTTDPADQSKWHEGCGSPQLAGAVA